MRRPLLRRAYLPMLRTGTSMRGAASADRSLLRCDGVAHRAAAAAYEGIRPAGAWAAERSRRIHLSMGVRSWPALKLAQPTCLGRGIQQRSSNLQWRRAAGPIAYSDHNQWKSDPSCLPRESSPSLKVVQMRAPPSNSDNPKNN